MDFRSIMTRIKEWAAQRTNVEVGKMDKHAGTMLMIQLLIEECDKLEKRVEWLQDRRRDDLEK